MRLAILPQQEEDWFKSITTALGAKLMEKIHGRGGRNFSVLLYKPSKFSQAWGHSLALSKKAKKKRHGRH